MNQETSIAIPIGADTGLPLYRPAGAEAARISANQFVAVPETTLPGGIVVPAFRVGKYLCTRGESDQVAVNAAGAPWVDISYHSARAACAAVGAALLTERQALAIAVNVAGVAVNWSGGAVGEGNLMRGLHLDLDDVDEPYPGTFVSPDPLEHRMFTLSNGEQIYDAAGNAYSWIFDDIQGDENGLVARAFAADSPSISSAPFPSGQRGMGWFPNSGNWSGGALLRGGCWCSYSYAGVFNLGYDSPGFGYSDVGFRCTTPVGL